MISRRAVIAGMAASALARPSLAQSGLGVLSDLARQAAVFATPMYETYRRRWRETLDPDNPHPLKLNQLDHAAVPSSSAPHALESMTWIDLTAEPMFLTLPDMDERDYCFAIVDMFGDTIDQVSRRRYGRRSPPHVLFGPTWTNPLPTGVRAIQATTNLVRLTGRIGVDGAGDLDAAQALQSRMLLETPATRNERRVLEVGELMPSRTVESETPIADWPAPHSDDPWDLFVVAARVLGESPVAARDAALVAEFVSLRLRPGRRFDLFGFSPKERAAMLDGIDAARAEIRAAAGRAISQTGVWRYPPLHPGDFGKDRLQRAVVATTDPFMPESAEAMTLVADADDSGAPLDGALSYVLDFSAGGPPPTRSVWSISMAGKAIGGLRRGATTAVELPQRAQGFSTVALYIVEPKGAVLDRTWRPPMLTSVQ